MDTLYSLDLTYTFVVDHFYDDEQLSDDVEGVVDDIDHNDADNDDDDTMTTTAKTKTEQSV